MFFYLFKKISDLILTLLMLCNHSQLTKVDKHEINALYLQVSNVNKVCCLITR